MKEENRLLNKQQGRTLFRKRGFPLLIFLSFIFVSVVNPFYHIVGQLAPPVFIHNPLIIHGAGDGDIIYSNLEHIISSFPGYCQYPPFFQLPSDAPAPE